MREPDREYVDGADWRHVSIHVFKTLPVWITINGVKVSEKVAKEIRDDLAAAITWYERRQADSEEGGSDA